MINRLAIACLTAIFLLGACTSGRHNNDYQQPMLKDSIGLAVADDRGYCSAVKTNHYLKVVRLKDKTMVIYTGNADSLVTYIFGAANRYLGKRCYPIIGPEAPYNFAFTDSFIYLSYNNQVVVYPPVGGEPAEYHTDSTMHALLYVYSLADKSKLIVKGDTALLYTMPTTRDMTGHPFAGISLGAFKMTAGQLVYQKSIIDKPKILNDIFVYEWLWPRYDLLKNDRIIYAYSNLDSIYIKDIGQDKIVLQKAVSDWEPSFYTFAFPRDSFMDIAYVKRYYVVRPFIYELCYDSFRRCIHILIKKEQPLISKEGGINNGYNADLVWLVIDEKGNLLKRYLMPSGIYLPNMLVLENGIAFRRVKNREHEISFDLYDLGLY